MSNNQQIAQSRHEAFKTRLKNWPALILLLYTFAVMAFYFDTNTWCAAFNLQLLKPLMAAASAGSLLYYFFIGSDGLKLLIGVHVFASIAIVAGMTIEWRTGVADFVIEIVRRVVFVTILVCLYHWDKAREAKVLSASQPVAGGKADTAGRPGGP